MIDIVKKLYVCIISMTDPSLGVLAATLVFREMGFEVRGLSSSYLIRWREQVILSNMPYLAYPVSLKIELTSRVSEVPAIHPLFLF
jgi:hypothetical protein